MKDYSKPSPKGMYITSCDSQLHHFPLFASIIVWNNWCPYLLYFVYYRVSIIYYMTFRVFLYMKRNTISKTFTARVYKIWIYEPPEKMWRKCVPKGDFLKLVRPNWFNLALRAAAPKPAATSWNEFFLDSSVFSTIYPW